MVKVSVEVRSGTARFRVGVKAHSVREALRLAGRMYPDRATIVKLAQGRENSFAYGAAGSGRVETEYPGEVAA